VTTPDATNEANRFLKLACSSIYPGLMSVAILSTPFFNFAAITTEKLFLTHTR